MRALLQDGSAALVKGSWLVEHSQNEGSRLPRRQDMPLEAFWDVDELMVGEQVRLGHEIVAVSHCWFTPEHPDPDGQQLQSISRFVGAFSDSRPGLLPSRVALFVDWCSLPQEPRSVSEDALFQQAIARSEIWFAHKASFVWQLTRVPDRAMPYHKRGWPLFEEAVCSLFPVSGQCLDLASVQFGGDCPRGKDAAVACATPRRPPIAPKVLAAKLRGCTFSRPEDLELLVARYETAFHAIAGSFECLDCRCLGWGDTEASTLSEALPHFKNLRELDLFNNEVGDFGAYALAEAVPLCKALQRVCLDENEIELGLEGPERLREAWQNAGKDPRGLWLA